MGKPNINKEKKEGEEMEAEKISQDTYMIKVDIPDEPDTFFSFKKLWRFTGPGFLMSIAYLDPGNIESDLQSGAMAKYRLIWVLLLAHILGLLLQRLAARLGVVSGKHMAEVAHSYYPRVPRIILWIMVEIAIIGSDMQEVIGTAISFYLLSDSKIPLYAGVLITITDTFTFLFLEKYGIRKFEFFFAFLISCMAGSFGYQVIQSKPNAGELFTGMILPWCTNCNPTQLLQAVSIVGAVIMPHNLYLHSALVKSRRVDRTRVEKVEEANKYFFIESFVALFASFWINVAVMAVFAAGLYGKSNMDIRETCYNTTNHMPNFYKDVFEANTDAAESDIFHAGIFLGCTFGVGALYVWAVGILAAGQSSTMTGTYAGQFAMEGFIQVRWPTWKRILVTRSLAIAPTLLVTIFSGGIEHISGLNDFLNCIQMVQLPFAIIPVLTFASDERIMKQFKLSLLQKIFSLVVSVLIILINFYFLYDWVGNETGWTAVSIPIVSLLAVFYIVCIIYLSYYCAVSMNVINPSSSKYLPPPIYSHFNTPWDNDNNNESSIIQSEISSNHDEIIDNEKKRISQISNVF